METEQDIECLKSILVQILDTYCNFTRIETLKSELIFSLDDNVCISDDHSLALACAWINLKECSLLASTLVVHFGFKMTPQAVETSGMNNMYLEWVCIIEIVTTKKSDFKRRQRFQNKSKNPQKMLKCTHTPEKALQNHKLFFVMCKVSV